MKPPSTSEFRLIRHFLANVRYWGQPEDCRSIEEVLQ
jgi:hypothetical protein